MTDKGQQFDIVVVGAGGAGLAAAITARQLGCSVALLESGAEVGGTTARSIGSITASGTRLQAAAGITDNVDDHFEDMAKFAGPRVNRDNLELRRLLVDHSAGSIDFLERLGVVFFGPMPEPPHRVPRMHNVLPSSRALVRLLAKRARRAGVEIFTETSATTLLRDGDGIGGVDASRAGRPARFAARRGVILTTGDFSGDFALRREHLAEELWGIDAANPESSGAGQRLGQEVGGAIVNADLVWGPEIRFIAPEGRNLVDRLPPSRAFARLVLWSLGHMPAAILRPFLMMFVTTNLAPNLALLEEGAILVNAEGRRFVEAGEDAAYAMARQPGKVAYFLADDRVAEKFSAWPHYISTAPITPKPRAQSKGRRFMPWARPSPGSCSPRAVSGSIPSSGCWTAPAGRSPGFTRPARPVRVA
jgi:fumarate reductase flavoprotein subunit